MGKVNLREVVRRARTALELIQIDADQKPIVLFTLDGEDVLVHFCQESEIRGYNHCNGNDCVLCAVGKEQKRRVLLPVYDPIVESVSVLSVSTSLRPHALLPLLMENFDEGAPRVIFVSRREYKYIVRPTDQKYTSSNFAQVIGHFKKAVKNSSIDLSTVYPRRANEQLKRVSEIAKLLELSGAGG